ncbi:hypothetical protein [Endozoicomonas acroporae]|uniref:hypothetical protein n=1 Tax=Endozoicomonas acroporae TaxID=1701104 RepID=UPI003D7A6DC4
MMIQSETVAIVYSVKRTAMDGKQYCSVILGNTPFGEAAANFKGGDVMKASCEPGAFEKFPEIDPMQPRRLRMLTTIKPAAGGKNQVHVLDFLSDETPSANKPAGDKAVQK